VLILSGVHIDFLGADGMIQISFTDAEYGIKRKRTRREFFLAELGGMVPWKEIEGLIEPVYPKAGNSRRPYEASVTIRIHFIQQW
jgi:IS5 family transposase